jgi:hypothetical protein
MKKFVLLYLFSVTLFAQAEIRVSWCGDKQAFYVQSRYFVLKTLIHRRSTLRLSDVITEQACEPGKTDVMWFDESSFDAYPREALRQHMLNGGVFLVEGVTHFEKDFSFIDDSSIGLITGSPEKNGLFYRSFYLLKTLDGCLPDSSIAVMMRKRSNAKAPVGVFVNGRYLTTGSDCFADNSDMKFRSLMNIFMAFLTTDYKEDQKNLPEILERIRNLGLEP